MKMYPPSGDRVSAQQRELEVAFNYDLLEDTFVMVEEDNYHKNKSQEGKDTVKVQIETSEGKQIHLSLTKVVLS